MENAAPSAPTKKRLQVLSLHMLIPWVLLAQEETQVLLGLLAEMVLPERMDSLALLVLLGPLALAADLSFPRWLMAVRSPAVLLNPDHQAPWVPVAPQDLQVHLALRDSLAPQASLVSLVLLVQWVLVVLPALLERTEKMVKLAKQAVPVSVEQLGLRVLVDSQEPLDSLASRDTEDSLV